jgi:hypothetical protein
MEDDRHDIDGDNHERSEDAVEAAVTIREEGAQEDRPYATSAISGWGISIEQRDDHPISTTDTNRLTWDMGDEIPESATGEGE